MIKIIFFDIDGTLLDIGKTTMSEKTIYALNKLKENNIKIFIATGRPSFVIPKFEVEFDGALSFNGQYCFDTNGPIFENPLDPDDVQTLIKNATRLGKPITVATRDNMRVNYREEVLDEYFRVASQFVPVEENFEEYSKQTAFQLMTSVPRCQDNELLEGTKYIQSVRWWDNATDLIPSNGGKDIGILKVLEYYGYSIEESMAFGDGGNDKSMIECVGCGVAMDNAKDDVKEVADYITLSVTDDGVYHALKHFNLI